MKKLFREFKKAEEIFDYKGFSKEKLEIFCDEKFVQKSPAKSKYWTSEVYSFGNHIRRYAYYPSFLPLYCYTDHGVGHFDDEIAEHELATDAPVQFYHSPKKAEVFKKSLKKPCYTMLSPFVVCRRMNKVNKLGSAKGTLAFPCHSTPEIDVNSNIEDYIKELKNLPDEFQPVSVCLHMHDIHKGQHEIFIKHGIPVYTAGHVFDQRFAQRFYDILKNFKYSTSNIVGSYTYYSVEMGIPFFVHGSTPLYINKSDPNLAQGEYKFQENENYKKIYSMFDGLFKEITQEQKQWVEKYLGLYDGVSRFQMAKILYGAYFKKANLFADLKYAFKNYKKAQTWIKFRWKDCKNEL